MLASTLGGLGFEVEIQRASVAARLAGEILGADVENVVARLRGTGGTRAPNAILLAAHYDSVPHSPGASDAGSAVAALLETARALRARPALRNDVIVLLSDAEEVGLLGKPERAEQHRWRNDVGVALNFEARGSRGAVAMYATSPGSAPLVHALAAAAPTPVANSLVGLLAQALPNDTDATIFMRFGYPTYAFAYAEGVADYHRYSDSVESLDPRTVQHDGEYALGLARHLGMIDLPSLRSSAELVYFDLFARVLVRYPPVVARLLAVLEIVLLGLLLALGARRGLLSVRGLGLGFVLALAGLLVLPLGVTLSHLVLAKLAGQQLLVERASPLAWHFLPLSGVLFVLLWHRALRKRGLVECGAGALAAVAVAAIVLGLLLPAASYPLAWPVLFALLGAIAWLRPRADDARHARRLDVATTLGLVPAAVLASSTVYTVFVLQGAFTPGAFAAFAAVPAPLLVPWLGRLGAGERRGLVAALLVVALGGAIAGLWPSTRVRPRSDSLVYALDAESGRARWLSSDRSSDPFVAQRVPGSALAEPIAAFSPFDEWRRAAPAVTVALDAATAEFEDGALRVHSPRAARCLLLWDDLGTSVRGARLDGRSATNLSRFSPELDEKLMSLTTGRKSRSGWRLRYCALRGRTLGLELDLRTDAVLRLRAVTITDGLPDPSLMPRAADLHPALDSDVTLVSSVVGGR
jgi:hypothetical protein